ncbi:hypothetical protein RHGRI_021193 [Rhododendron griersonianum]|uniref:AAA ATPase AAA+ lid domain-containing protein n=1 Tax=Rhododendron griersonianum TaxID=479676 RepID=A0AAV6JL81_9ERIC|nr:hypothetical protein RHGRI_021193 [Rhododendron griersonianum]
MPLHPFFSRTFRPPSPPPPLSTPTGELNPRRRRPSLSIDEPPPHRRRPTCREPDSLSGRTQLNLFHVGCKIFGMAWCNITLALIAIGEASSQSMVGLPSVESWEIILKTLLGKEKVENLDFKELANMTEGFSRSDLKNLCITAAYLPVRELIQQERLKDLKKKKKDEEGQSKEDAFRCKREESKEERVITLRPLNMEDMRGP